MSIPTQYYSKKLKNWVGLNKQDRVVFGEDIKADELKNIAITPGSIYEYKWMPGDKKGESVKDFWLSHALMNPSHCENENLTQSLFVLRIPGLEEEAAYETVKNQLKISNYISELENDDAELRNIAYFFNLNPTGKSVKSIFVELIDQTPMLIGKKYVPKGLLLRPGIVEKFFALYTKDNEESRIRVMLRKAIAFGVIKETSGVYYLNNIPIGSDFERIVMYVKENPEIYSQQIIPQVRAKDEYVPTKEVVTPKGDLSETNPLAAKNHLANLVIEATALRIPRAKSKKAETLEEDIKTAKALIAQAESLGIENWQSRVTYVDELPGIISRAKKAQEVTA